MENMILQPIVVGGQTFKNRIMFPPADPPATKRTA